MRPMNPKHLLLTAVAAAALSGCGVPDSPIRILDAVALKPGESDSGCEPESGKYVDSLPLDLALARAYSGLSGGWIFHWESTLQPSKVVVGGDVLSGAESNDFYAEAVDLSFRLEPSLATLSDTSVPLHAVLRAGQGGNDNTVGIPLMPASTVQELLAVSLTPTGAYLYVTFTVRGHRGGGSALSSIPVTFPIHVYDSGVAPGCPTDSQPVLSSCGGVLAADVTCSSAAAP